MLAQELVDAFRLEVVDVVRDAYLWSDDELLSFLDEAQRQFCRYTRGISDGRTAAVCEIPVSAGDLYSPLHASVKAIRTARRSDGTPVKVLNVDTIDRLVVDDYGSTRLSDPYSRVGPVVALVLGDTDGYVKWAGTPDADDTVYVTVFRGPLQRITSGDNELEVPDDYDWVLRKWVRHRAFGKRDAETYDAKLSREAELDFRTSCADVRREQERKVHAPREMSYGGL